MTGITGSNWVSRQRGIRRVVMRSLGGVQPLLAAISESPVLRGVGDKLGEWADSISSWNLWQKLMSDRNVPVFPLGLREKHVPLCICRQGRLFYATVNVDGSIDEDREVFKKIRNEYMNNRGWLSKRLVKYWIWDLKEIRCAEVRSPYGLN